MISRTAEYALRAAVCLASDRGRPFTTPEIAKLSRVPLDYLAKVMQALVRSGLVRSRRGKGGGFLLAEVPKEITALDIVRAVEPIPRLHGCPLGLPTHEGGLCPLHRKLDEAAAEVERALEATPIAALLEGADHRTPLCLPPPAKVPAAPRPRSAPSRAALVAAPPPASRKPRPRAR
jgi:Rrf2 family protein